MMRQFGSRVHHLKAMFENYSIDELNRILTLSRWGVATLAVLTACVGILNQVISDRIAVIQKTEKNQAKKKEKDAEDKIAAAQADADAARKLVSALEQRQRPRLLSEDVLGEIIKIASLSEDKADLEIHCISGDAEAMTLAEQIRGAFISGGYQIKPITAIVSADPYVGLEVSVHQALPSATQTCLAQVLKYFDIPLVARPRLQKEEPNWLLMVGSKP